MSDINLRSPAKINLTLDILGKDERVGKHFVNTVLYRDDRLFDELVLRKIVGNHNELICNTPGVPKSSLNTVLQALELLDVKGWEVTLVKNIPLQAGLGGGSSNAAAILKHFGMQKRIPEPALMELGAQIGADVPFFILEDNLAYCEGFGDQVVQSWTIPTLSIEYVKTGVQVPTADAYAQLDLAGCGTGSVKTEALVKELNEKGTISAELLAPYLHNDFETSFFAAHSQWQGKGHLCGSGGTIYTVLR